MQSIPSVWVVSLAMCAAGSALMGCANTKGDVRPDPSELTGSPTAETPNQMDPTPGSGTGGWSCPTDARGAKMVLIPVEGGKPYCIDEREAVYGEYKEFVDVKGSDFSDQPPECDWNDDYGPVVEIDRGWADYPPEPCGPSLADADPDRAVGCLDFCDAWAYCSWAGKRLCGLRGAQPGKVNSVPSASVAEWEHLTADVKSHEKGEWSFVCSQGGTSKYPYGDEFAPGACVDNTKIDAAGDRAYAVRDTTDNECRGTHSPFDQVYNTVGSVPQWLNFCISGMCATEGGTADEALSCEGAFAMPYYRKPRSGVRCCADAVSAAGASQ